MKGIYFFLLFTLIIIGAKCTIKNQWMVNNRWMVEGFDNTNTLLTETFDTMYPKLYNKVFYLKDLFHYDAAEIIKRLYKQNQNQTTSQTTSQIIDILDVGCGTGHHLKSILETIPKTDADATATAKLNIVGMDRSRNMLQLAQMNMPAMILKHYSFLNPNSFKPASIGNILCLRDTIYHAPLNSLSTVLNNFAKWLVKDGLLYITIYDRDKLEPSPRDYSQIFKGVDNKIKSVTYFKSFSHEATWTKLLDKNVVIYNEKYLLNNGHYKNVSTTLYMLPQNEMISKILEHGFKVKDIVSYDKLGIDFMKLYIFTKL